MASDWVGTIVSGFGAFGSWAWILLVVRALFHRTDRVPQLADLSDDEPEGGWPSLSVAFAARNEGAMVGPATLSILGQDYPGLRVTAVDDRSTDETGAILDEIARQDARLSVVHVRDLPAGWLGKNHALQEASEDALAEWLLLTDADIVFAPGTLRRAVRFAVVQKLDHLTLAPDVVTESFAERSFLAMFCLAFALKAPPWQVNDRRRKATMGVGAFNLVRLDAFRAVGGFKRLSLSVDDDMQLGRALKFAGYRPGLLIARGRISVRWQVGIGGMIRGLEKNFFAAVGFRLWVVPFSAIAVLVVGVMPYVGVFVGPWWQRCFCLAGVASIALTLKQAEGTNGMRWYHAFGVPFGAAAIVVALLRSTFLTLSNGGVRWRDHLYPLAELKAHVRRRNAWMRELWASTR